MDGEKEELIYTHFKCKPNEKAAWTKAAEAEGFGNLSAFIRVQLNQATKKILSTAVKSAA